MLNANKMIIVEMFMHAVTDTLFTLMRFYFYHFQEIDKETFHILSI